MVLEGGEPYLQPRKVEENLEDRTRREPKTCMFTNASGTQHINQIAQELRNGALVLSMKGSIHSKITINLAVKAFIIHWRDIGRQCGGEC